MIRKLCFSSELFCSVAEETREREGINRRKWILFCVLTHGFRLYSGCDFEVLIIFNFNGIGRQDFEVEAGTDIDQARLAG